MKRSGIALLFLALPMAMFANVNVNINANILFDPVESQQQLPQQGTRWNKVAADSARFLTLQHVYRISFQEKTQRYLGGSFFKDYGRSVKGLGGWKDGDSLYTNYILHPMQGAASGFLFIHNNSAAEEAEFGKSGEYWRSRLKAFAFSAIYSAQFELGPMSEASLGNVGATPGTMALVDLVITPVGGFVWILAEDALDRFVIRKIEKKWKKAGWIRFVRVALNPVRSFANLMRFKLPWYRRGRELNRILPVEPPLEEPAVEIFPEELWIGDEETDVRQAAGLVILLPA